MKYLFLPLLFLVFGCGNSEAQSGFGIPGGQQQAPAIQEIQDPTTWKFSIDTVPCKSDEFILNFDVKLEDAWDIYSMFQADGGPIPTVINFENKSGIKLIGKGSEKGTIAHDGFDEIFEMNVKAFKKNARFSQHIKVTNFKAPITGYITYQTCKEICINNETDFSFTIKPRKSGCDASTQGTVIDTTSNVAEITPEDTGTTSEPVFEAALDSSFLDSILIDNLTLNAPVSGCGADTGVDDVEQQGLLGIFLLGMIGGFIALLTPCVFPMIPLTVSFFTKGSADRKKGVFNAFLYGFFIFLIYVLLSAPFHVLDGLNPNILNEISTSVGLNLAFFVIFIIFSFSFFGYYEIQLPTRFTNRIDSASDIGGVIGIFFMAFTLALVSFSCTGPILGSLLGLTAEGGTSAVELTAGMAGFGLALALPFALFAAFPGWLNSLPKSGGWLNNVKVIIAFVEIGLAFKFFSNADLVQHWGILKREIFFGIWILCSLGLFLYLIGVLKFPHDSPVKSLPTWRKVAAAMVLAFGLYITPGITNTKYANVRLVSGFPPPLYYSIYDRKNECPLDLDCHKDDYQAAVETAKKQNKPIIIDFTGYGCVNCRKNEENVWVEPEVYNKLNDEYVLVSLYVDDKRGLEESEKKKFEYNGNTIRINTKGQYWGFFQLANFKNAAQPHYVILSPDETLLTKPVGGLMTTEDFVAFLNCGLEGFNAHKDKLSLK